MWNNNSTMGNLLASATSQIFNTNSSHDCLARSTHSVRVLRCGYRSAAKQESNPRNGFSREQKKNGHGLSIRKHAYAIIGEVTLFTCDLRMLIKCSVFKNSHKIPSTVIHKPLAKQKPNTRERFHHLFIALLYSSSF